jgi:hypothetical protein
MVRVPGYRTEMHYVPCEVRTEFIYFMYKIVDHHCGLLVVVPGYKSEVPRLIPGATDFLSSGPGIGST